jgi:hypothetical protein
MRVTCAIAFALLIACAFNPVHCNESHFGIDDWSAADVAKRLKNDVQIDVPTAAIAAVGLQGSTLHSIADVDLSGLGLQTAEVAAIRQYIVNVLHRANTKPVDFWEWRAANRRLFDGWILPLAGSPHALLIWMRFFDSNAAIGATCRCGVCDVVNKPTANV